MFLRMVARPLMAKVKETTGIVGLEVVPNAREVLISLYGKTLKEIQAVPEDEGYRKAVESFTRHRLKVCQEEDDWEIIEKRLACGQVEELIEEAQDELKLIAKMIARLRFKPRIRLNAATPFIIFSRTESRRLGTILGATDLNSSPRIEKALRTLVTGMMDNMPAFGRSEEIWASPKVKQEGDEEQEQEDDEEQEQEDAHPQICA
ncbi:hypothetical protein TEA_014215 [Camellia sinensis var. sinensis]|uniref:Uncharacterized protein n=1 Tax=Camellia sinensis var. sinensis TaxID=542762 RepID=A0A4S4EE11_CAMSN|nr:hypothetical protein TEA_014215 [Camellia sinensis var. sinensis]